MSQSPVWLEKERRDRRKEGDYEEGVLGGEQLQEKPRKANEGAEGLVAFIIEGLDVDVTLKFSIM